MISALLLLVLLVVGVVLASRRFAGRTAAGPVDVHVVRHFFQYLLLLGLLVVTAIGVSGLLGRALEGGTLARADETDLARNLTFTLVGLPLLLALAISTRRQLQQQAEEGRSTAWAAFVTVASLTALAVTVSAVQVVLDWAVGVRAYDSGALASTVVWGATWGGLWWVEGRSVPQGHRVLHHLAGSGMGLWTAAAGLGTLVAVGVRALFSMPTDLLTTGGHPALHAGVTLAVGAVVWVQYWVRTAHREPRTGWWVAYTLLAGVGAGFVVGLVAASTVLYDALVWLAGRPTASSAAGHFAGSPEAAGLVVAGALVWWYHRAVLEQAEHLARTEARRVYEYLLAGAALVAAAAGVATLVVAALEGATSSTVLTGASPVNTVLAAVTLLAVGAPVWAFYWRLAQRAVHAEPRTELESPTRRAYLFVLLGASSIAAVVTLIVAVYQFFDAAFRDTLGAATLRSARFALGILLAAAAVAAYHWTVYRADRAAAPTHRRGPRYVLVLGPHDPDLARTLARSTGGRVQAWSRTDDGYAAAAPATPATPATPPTPAAPAAPAASAAPPAPKQPGALAPSREPVSAEAVLAALGETTAEELVVLCDAGRLRAIPVHPE
ncbi:DUF5671 domain-containing protein [Pedococcus sp. NPDC057267]|uniref:DUF5671 domain-containing protein n=1 Tax=Pedococcus sp. NPDC057267 TaxID=3346077 RepID=UPI003630BA5E